MRPGASNGRHEAGWEGHHDHLQAALVHKVDRARAEVNDCARSEQKVHTQQAVDGKTIVHVTDVNLEAVQCTIAHLQVVNLADENRFDAANAVHVAQLVLREGQDADLLPPLLASSVTTTTSGMSVSSPW